ncbi:HAD family hydrolase [bacterium]|nr:HAD family hydrolase [bacterium]
MTPFLKPTQLSQYKGVLIDLDNTLYLHDPCHNAAIKAVYDYAKDAGLVNEIDSFNAGYQIGRKAVQKRLFPQGVCRSRLLYFQAMLDAMGHSEKLSEALEMESCYKAAFLANMTLDTDAHAFLKQCKDADIPVCVVTNLNTQFQIQKLQALDIMPYVSYLVTSEEAGVEKPEPAIFELALSKMDMSVHDVVMIGDDKEKDSKGAEQLGITAVTIELC